MPADVNNLDNATLMYWRVSLACRGRSEKPMNMGNALKALGSVMDAHGAYGQRPLTTVAGTLLETLIVKGSVSNVA